MWTGVGNLPGNNVDPATVVYTLSDWTPGLIVTPDEVRQFGRDNNYFINNDINLYRYRMYPTAEYTYFIQYNCVEYTPDGKYIPTRTPPLKWYTPNWNEIQN